MLALKTQEKKKEKMISYLQRELRRSILREDNALFFVCFVFFHLPRFVRSLLRRFFLVYAIRCLLRRAIPGMRGPDWSNGALNEVAIKRAKSHAADYAFSRPRASPERTSASD